MAAVERDVQAARGIERHDQPWLVRQLARQHPRCTLPPESVRCGASADGTVKPSRARRRRDRRAPRPSRARSRRRARIAGVDRRHVLERAELATAARARVLGDEGHAARPHPRDRPVGGVRPASRLRPARHASTPRMTSPSSRWPLPATPATRRSRRADGEIDVGEPRAVRRRPHADPLSSRIGARRAAGAVDSRGDELSASASSNISETSAASVASARAGSRRPTRRITVMRSATRSTSASLWAMKTIA